METGTVIAIISTRTEGQHKERGRSPLGAGGRVGAQLVVVILSCRRDAVQARPSPQARWNAEDSCFDFFWRKCSEIIARGEGCTTHGPRCGQNAYHRALLPMDIGNVNSRAVVMCTSFIDDVRNNTGDEDQRQLVLVWHGRAGGLPPPRLARPLDCCNTSLLGIDKRDPPDQCTNKRRLQGGHRSS